MKQELSTTESKASPFSQSPAPATRVRVSRPKESTRGECTNGTVPGLGLKPIPKHSTVEANNTQRSRRSVFDVAAPREREMEDARIAGRPGSRAVEQYARFRQRLDANCKGTEDERDVKAKELQRRLDASESLVKELQAEVVALKAQLEKVQGSYVAMESQNKQLTENLSAAQAKISALEKSNQQMQASVSKDIQTSEFRDVRKVIGTKLDKNLRGKQELIREEDTIKTSLLGLKSQARVVEIQPKIPISRSFPPPPAHHAAMNGLPPRPPPPPPLPSVAPTRTNTMQKATALVELYHSLTKRDGKMAPLGNGNSAGPVANNAHNSIVGEIKNRSAHLLAIKADVETKGDFIKRLIEKVQSAAYTDIEDVLTFVDWLDKELSTLADERAVLKHFDWPEKKADALREAAFEYRDLKRLELEVSFFEDDPSQPCEASLKKIVALLDKSERSIQRLMKLRDTTMLSYRDCKIPTDWMLDTGMIRKIKLASVNLAKVYMKRVSMELKTIRRCEGESTQEALLVQGVRFAYRAHQFAGGLDSETMSAFEELRKRVQLHGRGSRELLSGMTPS